MISRCVKHIFLNIITILLVSTIFVSNAYAAEENNCETKGLCASATSAIAASYSTQGYWSLSAILTKLGAAADGGTGPNSYLAKVGALIYILTIVGALVMMALGQPPKMYGWFAAGPGLFYFLLFTPVGGSNGGRKGVEWKLPHMSVADIEANQKEVWRLAKSGLVSNPLIGDVTGTFEENGPANKARVPYVFAKVDDFASEVAQNLINLMGLTVLAPIAKDTPPDLNKWHLLSNNKWELLENITQSKIYSTDIRELLVVFMSSECGDKMGQYINKAKFASASSTNGSQLPKKIYESTDTLFEELRYIRLPTPFVLTQLLKDASKEGFREFAFKDLDADARSKLHEVPSIACDDMLWLVMQGFRWESAVQYAHLPQTVDIQASDPVALDLLNYVFLYDWEFGGKKQLGSVERQQFMHNLIMAYMIRNELAVVPSQVEQRMLPGEKASHFAEEFQRNINSKNKFSEFYTWAKLMPHMQGLLLYILAIGYPLACVMIIIPGYWKWMFTWLSFYLWAKSWDVGFAVVMNLEKAIWGNIGKSLATESINERVLDLNTNIVTSITPGSQDVLPKIDATTRMLEAEALTILEKGMIISRALNHDLANSYYIYLMSALYFAVPALTGQVILGAKSGMSSMVDGAIKGVSGEGGAAAKAGAVGEVTQHGKLNAQAASQTHAAKSTRRNGLALKAMQQKNSSMGLELGASALQTRASIGRHAADRARDRQGLASSMQGVDMAEASKLFGAMDTGLAHLSRNGSSGKANSGASGSKSGGSGGSAQGHSGIKEKMKALAGTAKDVGVGVLSANSSYAQGLMKQEGAEHDLANTVYSGNQSQKARNAGLESDVGGLALGSRAKGLGESSQRLMQKANFQAQEGSYREDSKFAQQIAGQMSALGVSPGTFEPTNKPRGIEEMGAGGMFGGAYDNAFGYPTNSGPGGYFGQLGGHVGNAKQAASAASIRYDNNMDNSYMNKGVTELMGQSWTDFGSKLKE